MLAADILINDLAAGESAGEYKDYNGDYNLVDVLKLYGENTPQRHKIRYSDGREEYFSFDD